MAHLLLLDEVEKAETLLNSEAKSAESVALRGEIEFRRGDFAKAESFYREALGMDEKTARAHFGLGKLALSKLKSKEAIKELARAVELAPGEAIFHMYAGEAYGLERNYTAQKSQLQEYVRLNPVDDPDRLSEAKAVLEMFEALGTGEVGTVVGPDNPAPLPFSQMLNLIFTKVMINGKGPFNFVIDTGASQVVLSEKLTSQLGLKPVTTTVMHGVGGGGKVESKLFKVDELGLGQVKVKNLPVGTFNDPLVTQLSDGIIGTSVLSDFTVTVNYPGNQLELTKKAVTTPTVEVLSGPGCFSNLLLVPLVVNGQFRGNFVVDTGAVTTVLSHTMAARLGVNENTEGAKIEMGLSGVGGMEGLVLRVPNVTLKSEKTSQTFPQVVAIDLKEISKMVGTEVSGVVGFDFLSQYKVVLDYNGVEVRLVK